MHDKIAYLIKHYRWIQCLYQTIMGAVFRIWGCFTGFDGTLVLLSSMSGDQYGGSPKAVFEEMKKDPRFKGYHYVWAFSRPENYDVEGATKIKIDSPEYFRTALRARIWITDVNIERGLHFKKKKTIYLNTTHGTGPKKGGNAVSGRKDYDFSYVDIVCCDGQYTHDVLLDSYNAKEENLLWCGRPREDSLYELTEQDRKRVRQSIGIPEGKKAILYMPTWREGTLESLTPSVWEEKLGKDYIVLVRAHHFTKSKLISEKGDFWRDVSDYPDVNELYVASDILVSDYSSAFFDFGLLKKPMVCYAYDYDEFYKNYGLYFDLRQEFPNGVMSTEEETIDFILGMDYASESKKCGEYCATVVKHPCNATKACVDRINELCEER